MKRQPHDWNSLKNLFVQSNLSVLAFCKENKLNRSVALRHIKRDHWEKARIQFRNKVTTAIEKQGVKDYAKTWTRLENSWELLLTHAEASLRPKYTEDVKTKELRLEPVGIETQAKAANVLDHVTKNLRLLAGESTEKIDNTDPKLEGMKDDVNAINRAIVSEMADIEKLQKCLKTKACK